MKGLADVSLDITGEGLDTAGILASSSGHGHIVAGAGVIDQTRLNQWAQNIILIALSSAFEPVSRAKVNCMVGYFDIEAGEVTTDSLLLDTERVTVAGSGEINLETEQINLLLTPAPKSPKLVSLANPVRLTGHFSDPDVTLDKKKEVWMLGGLLAGLANPATLILFYADIGTMGANPCEEALQKREEQEKKAARQGKKAPASLPGGLFKGLLRPFE